MDADGRRWTQTCLPYRDKIQELPFDKRDVVRYFWVTR